MGCSSAAHGILPDQGSNPCLLHRQVDSLPLSHQGSSELHLRMGAKSISVSPGWGLHLPPALAWSFRTGPPPRMLTHPGRWGSHTPLWALNPGAGQPWGMHAHHSAPESVPTSCIWQKPGEEEDDVRSHSHTTNTPSANKALLPPCTHPGKPASRGWGSLDQGITAAIPTSLQAPARRKCNPQLHVKKESPT